MILFTCMNKKLIGKYKNRDIFIYFEHIIYVYNYARLRLDFSISIYNMNYMKILE